MLTIEATLSRAGETKAAREKRGAVFAAMKAESVEKEPLEGGKPWSGDDDYPRPEVSSPELSAAALRLRAGLIAVQQACEQKLIDPQTTRLQRFLSLMRDQFLQTMNHLQAEVASLAPGKEKGLIRHLRVDRMDFSRLLQREIERLVEDDKSATTDKAFRESFERLDLLAAEAKETILVVQEPERFIPLLDDSFFVRSVKRLKRWRRNTRRFFGAASELKREVPFRLLVRHHCAAILPQRLMRAANLIGAQTLLALRGSKNLYDRIDQYYETIVTALEAIDGDQQSQSELNEVLKNAHQEMQEKFDAAAAVQRQFNATIKKDLTITFSQSYAALLSDLTVAGTFELPRRRFRHSRSLMREKTQQEIAKAGAIWKSYTTGFAGAYTQHLDAIRLMDQVSLTADETVFNVLESIDANLANRLLEARDRCAQGSAALAAAFDAGLAAEELKQEISRQRDECCDFVRSVTLRKLNHLRESRELNALIEVMLERFSALAGELPEHYRILDEKSLELIEDFGLTPAAPNLISVPLREIARSFLETRITRDLAEVNRLMFEQVDGSMRTVTEACQIVSFNLRVAAEECEREAPRPAASAGQSRTQAVALDGLQLAITRLDAALTDLSRLKEEVYDQIIARVDVRMREVEALAFQRASAEEKAGLRQKLLLARGSRYLDRAQGWLKSNYKDLVARYRPLGRVVVKDMKTTLGLQQFTAAEILATYDQAKLDQAELQHLPFIYRRLFDISPLESADLLVARDEELRLIETARERWQQGMPCAVAVIGELGSGKTSLINAAVEETLKGFPVYKRQFVSAMDSERPLAEELALSLRLSPAQTLEQLEWQINEMAEHYVIVIEDAHQLYQRTLGGFETLRKLLLLIARTSRQILWIISIRKYAWRYLNSVLRIADSFTFVVNTENLSGPDLEKVILARHKVSGFDLRFLPDEFIVQRRRYRLASEPERQAMIRRAYFEALSKASEGNVLAAIFYWLKSLLEVERNELIVRPLSELRFDFLHDVPVEQLLTLSMLIQHGNLTAAEHAQIFGAAPDESLAMLTHLANINLLTKDVSEDSIEHFAVNRVIYIPLTRELRARNILP
ncbi:MAG: hypothetical protein MOB07_13420 [Acidobacteria bacterium]|nr:hypothetical protein [Acidobacteriota bacterium]